MNLIGEHTDYNEGLVMPVAIEFAVYVEATGRTDRRLAVYSENYSETREFELDDAQPRASGDWGDYVRGVAVMLERAGHRVSWRESADPQRCAGGRGAELVGGDRGRGGAGAAARVVH